MDNRDVKKVIAIFKTHLDIGYTALARDVLRRYREEFIPAAVSLAERANAGCEKRFVWTTGSYLIKHALEHADMKARERLEAAVRRGDVAWHGLACTTHTELMDEALFQYDLSISKELDGRFGKKTVAAKMTDVPGHTIAMVPHLAGTGIEYLHLGVNTGSRVPEVPELFRWRYGKDEIIVNYAGGYGSATVLENGVALEFCHALDNAGPPSIASLAETYRALEARYPNARIEAGTLDDFALAVREVRNTLPVVTEEIGDTWIHGVATDPVKVSHFMRLLKLAGLWRARGAFSPQSPEYGAFMENLLLVAEHTWGMDVKKHLLDFTNWTKADFQTVRAADRTDYSLFSPRNAHIFIALRDELREYRGENEVSSYSLFEESHAEQRGYVQNALDALPADLRDEAQGNISFHMPEIPEGRTRRAGEPFEIGPWRVTLGQHGEIARLENPAQSLDIKARLGLFCYETFDGKTASDCFFEYGRDLKKNFHWAECDFSKPGLRYEESIKRRSAFALPRKVVSSGNRLYISLLPEKELCESYGCPREIMIMHEFGDTIQTELYWREKDAIRSPEAIYFGMSLSAADPNGWQVEKLGLPVSPFCVARGGNRKLHCARNLAYDGADCAIGIESMDAPLLSVGGRHLYDVDDAYGDMADGMWYLLYNNRWGTNFRQWFEEDMRFAFETRLAGKRQERGKR